MIATANAAVFDVHSELVLQNGWYIYGAADNAAAPANFASLWHGVDSALVARWQAELSRHPPVFHPAKQPRSPASEGAHKLPLILVELLEESEDLDFLGRSGFVDQVSGKDVRVEFHKQKIAITVLSRSPSLTRSLYVIARGSMTLAEHAFIEEGYSSVRFLSGGPLEPEEELIAEESGVFGRRQFWECQAQLAYMPTTTATPKKGWFVALDDVLVSDVAGGVTVKG